MRYVPITSSQFFLESTRIRSSTSQGEAEGRERRHRLIVCRDCTLIYAKYVSLDDTLLRGGTCLCGGYRDKQQH